MTRRVRKISIIPRTHALGVTVHSPETDRYTYTVRYLHGRIAGMLAGRAAEKVVFGDTSTGAENDLQQATQLARQMVGRWGVTRRGCRVRTARSAHRTMGRSRRPWACPRDSRTPRRRGAPHPRRLPRHLPSTC